MEEAEEPKKAKVEGETPVQVKAFWRELSVKNIKSLARVAEKTHPDLPERDEVFAERANLFPGGCLSLMEGKSNELGGYVISHPIKYLQTPALDSLLGEIASDANQYYIHVLAILPESKDMALRGSASTSSWPSPSNTRRPASSLSMAQNISGAVLGLCRCGSMMY